MIKGSNGLTSYEGKSMVEDRGKLISYYCRFCDTTWPAGYFKTRKSFTTHCLNCAASDINISKEWEKLKSSSQDRRRKRSVSALNSPSTGIMSYEHYQQPNPFKSSPLKKRKRSISSPPRGLQSAEDLFKAIKYVQSAEKSLFNSKASLSSSTPPYSDITMGEITSSSPQLQQQSQIQQFQQPYYNNYQKTSYPNNQLLSVQQVAKQVSSLRKDFHRLEKDYDMKYNNLQQNMTNRLDELADCVKAIKENENTNEVKQQVQVKNK